METLSQHFLGCGRGVDQDGSVPVDDRGRPLRGRQRGAFQWTRRPPTIAELEMMGRALVAAAERVARRLNGELPEPQPEAALAAADDRDFDAVARRVLEEARGAMALIGDEIERRA